MIEHLSYSSISSYLSCARNWAYKYVEKKPTISTPELAFGTAVHETIEQHLLGKGELIDLWTPAWNKAAENGNIFWGMDTPEQFYNDGVRILSHSSVTGGIRLIQENQNGNPPKIETKVELRVPGVPIPVVGYIDIITANGIPGDFKTSRASWSQAKAQDSIQTLFYLAALNQAGNHEHAWRFRHYVIVKTKTPQFQVLDHTHKPSELFWLFGMIQNVWKAIQSGIYPENPTTWLCNPEYCDFWKLCRGKYD